MSTLRMSVDLPATPHAPKATRELLRAMLSLWGCGSALLLEDMVLLANEIVTNAIDHAGTEHALVLELAHSDGWWRVSVADGSAIRPVVRELTHAGPRGWGMRLVEQLAYRWGAEDHHGGKKVWFEMVDE